MPRSPPRPARLDSVAPGQFAARQAAARAARATWRIGQQALRNDDIATGLRWLDRACRLAPNDAVLRLGLATAWLRQDPAHAATLFAVLSATHDVRETWLGLAAARLQSGDPAAAARALASALSRFPAPADRGWVPLADRIAPGGWCARTAAGALCHGPADLPPPEISAATPGGWLHVRRNGEDVTGSPMDLRGGLSPDPLPSALPPGRRPRKPPKATPVFRPADIVIPVYADAAKTLACLASVLAARPTGARIVVIDDATPEPCLAVALDRLAARRRILLIRHTRNQGFPTAANAGLAMARASGHDALLLNADTLVAPGFLARLRTAAYAAPDIGTACPLSNNATILSYPDPTRANPMPDQAETTRLAAQAWDANGKTVTEIPTGVGFCLYLRHDCLDTTGGFRAEIFGRGYGEENDFCARATAAGWRHVAAPGVFVAHVGEASFGATATALRARNAAVLDRLHPSYKPRLAAHLAADPLFPARRRLDTARFLASHQTGAKAVLLVTHALGGGVARSLSDRVAILRAGGLRPVVLSPTPDRGAQIDGFPNLRFALPEEADALLKLLRGSKPARLEFHHTLGHHPALWDLPGRLKIPHSVHIHDYHWLCPRLVLTGAEGRYCGEPDVAGCTACIRRRGSLLDEAIGIADLHARSARLFAAATDVVAPSQDTASRIQRHFPAIAPRVARPPEPPATRRAPPRLPAQETATRRIAVIGAIGPPKGFHILLALARDAVATDRPIEFVVVGHTIDDAKLLRTGRVFITGPYRPDEADSLIRAQHADFALLPSVVPETWCHTLTEAWSAGLQVAAFDLGAQAERIRAGGRGFLLPLGLSAGAINDALLAARW